MTDNLTILKEVEAVLEGHFLLSSGKHSNKYCQCAKLLRFRIRLPRCSKASRSRSRIFPLPRSAVLPWAELS